ncbi:hypothetical protein C8J57DRAFT_1502618 [Mycena rebaudengoi]|nr:hypothetical protein C8J57DRAFT_1502618 [Mycena rebaudengoi]
MSQLEERRIVHSYQFALATPILLAIHDASFSSPHPPHVLRPTARATPTLLFARAACDIPLRVITDARLSRPPWGISARIARVLALRIVSSAHESLAPSLHHVLALALPPPTFGSVILPRRERRCRSLSGSTSWTGPRHHAPLMLSRRFGSSPARSSTRGLCFMTWGMTKWWYSAGGRAPATTNTLPGGLAAGSGQPHPRLESRGTLRGSRVPLIWPSLRALLCTADTPPTLNIPSPLMPVPLPSHRPDISAQTWMATTPGYTCPPSCAPTPAFGTARTRWGRLHCPRPSLALLNVPFFLLGARPASAALAFAPLTQLATRPTASSPTSSTATRSSPLGQLAPRLHSRRARSAEAFICTGFTLECGPTSRRFSTLTAPRAAAQGCPSLSGCRVNLRLACCCWPERARLIGFRASTLTLPPPTAISTSVLSMTRRACPETRGGAREGGADTRDARSTLPA